jgi:hypothetical protein
MNKDQLTHFLIRELHRLVAANIQTRAVLGAMRHKSIDAILSATLDRQLSIAENEERMLAWLLAEQGEANTGLSARPVELMANDGWLATTQEDKRLRDVEIATVSTQIQSYHLASWLGVAAMLRSLNLHAEADLADEGCHALRRLAHEIESLRPTLLQTDANVSHAEDWYRPSARRHRDISFAVGF